LAASSLPSTLIIALRATLIALIAAPGLSALATAFALSSLPALLGFFVIIAFFSRHCLLLYSSMLVYQIFMNVHAEGHLAGSLCTLMPERNTPLQGLSHFHQLLRIIGLLWKRASCGLQWGCDDFFGRTLVKITSATFQKTQKHRVAVPTLAVRHLNKKDKSRHLRLEC